MNNPPAWLPDMITVDGVWEAIVGRLYAIFVTDIKNGKPYLNTAPVWWDRRILEGEEYEEGFWHLISKHYDDANDRLPDFRRAERLPWCRACIDNFNDENIMFWDYKFTRRQTDTYIWLREFDYVIVFRKRNLRVGTVYFLKTAYYVEGNATRRRLRKSYEKREP
jgi:hypothetical protein